MPEQKLYVLSTILNVKGPTPKPYPRTPKFPPIALFSSPLPSLAKPLTIIVLRQHIAPGCEQQLHRFGVALLGGHVEGGRTFALRCWLGIRAQGNGEFGFRVKGIVLV